VRLLLHDLPLRNQLFGGVGVTCSGRDERGSNAVYKGEIDTTLPAQAKKSLEGGWISPLHSRTERGGFPYD